MGKLNARWGLVCAAVVAMAVLALLHPMLGAGAGRPPRLMFPLIRRAYPPFPATPWLHGIDNGDGDGNYWVGWDWAERADEFELQEQREGGEWLNAFKGATTEVELRDRPAGSYAYRCRGLNGWGEGQWSNTQYVSVQGKAPGTLSRPSSSSVSAGGKAVVKIYNDSPYVMRMTFTGPEAKVMELPKCDVCHVYSFIGPIFCPTSGRPVGELQLAPGTYRVYLTFSDPSVRPSVGNWELSANRRYQGCVYVMSTWVFSSQREGQFESCQ